MIYIVTGPIRSGKTTALQQWISARTDVRGILTPDVNGQRMFLNIASQEQFTMQATVKEESIAVGRFSFSKQNFEKACAVIRSATGTNDWLVIDEIGPLELRGEGFAETLKQVLRFRQQKIILVVREGLTEKVQKYFALYNTVCISTAQLSSIKI